MKNSLTIRLLTGAQLFFALLFAGFECNKGIVIPGFLALVGLLPALWATVQGGGLPMLIICLLVSILYLPLSVPLWAKPGQYAWSIHWYPLVIGGLYTARTIAFFWTCWRPDRLAMAIIPIVGFLMSHVALRLALSRQ